MAGNAEPEATRCVHVPSRSGLLAGADGAGRRGGPEGEGPDMSLAQAPQGLSGRERHDPGTVEIRAGVSFTVSGLRVRRDLRPALGARAPAQGGLRVRRTA